jgi:hypothetical protein
MGKKSLIFFKDGKPAFTKLTPSQDVWIIDIGAVQYVWRTLKTADFDDFETRRWNKPALGTHLVLFISNVVQKITQLWNSLMI